MRGKYQKKRERKAIAGVANSLAEVQLEGTELSARVRNALQAGGVVTLLDLAGKTDDQLLAIKNIGQSALSQIHEMMDGIADVAKYRSVMNIG